MPGASGKNWPKVERKHFARTKGVLWGYARISTDKQDGQYQKVLLLKAGVPENNIVLDTFTGRSMERPEFLQLDARMRAGDTFVTPALHRVGRCDLAAEYMIRLYTKRGINIVILDNPWLNSVNEAMDDNLRNGFIWIMSYVAKQTLIGLSFNTRAGMRTLAASQGMKPGRKPINPETAELIREYFDKGWSKAKISRTLNVGRTTVSLYVRNRDYNPEPPRLAASTIERRIAQGIVVDNESVRTHRDRRLRVAPRIGKPVHKNGLVARPPLLEVPEEYAF